MSFYKIISMIVVVSFLSLFLLGCNNTKDKNTIEEVPNNINILSDKIYPMLNNVDYGMSKEDTFKSLGLSESQAFDKRLNVNESPTIITDSFVFENIKIDNIEYNIQLAFTKLKTNDKIVDIGLNSITLTTDKRNEDAIISGLKRSKFNVYSSNNNAYDENSNSITLTHYTCGDDMDISAFCKNENVDYKEFLDFYSTYCSSSVKTSESIFSATTSTCSLSLYSFSNSNQIYIIFNGYIACMIRQLKK